MSSNATELIIVRHGETVWNLHGRLMNQLDSPLTSQGLKQAQHLAARFAATHIDALYASPLGRALTTAEYIGQASQIKVTTVAELREHSLGVFAGYTMPELEELFPEELRLYRTDAAYTPPDGESKEAFHRRTVACLIALSEAHINGRALVVAHGGTLAAVFRHILGLAPDAVIPCRVPNAGVNVFEVGKHEWRIKTWGDVSHLNG